MAVPELRRDPLTGRWVILAADRSSRPHPGRRSTEPPARHRVVPDCPFCPGHEGLTPPELARAGAGRPGEPGWTVRVVPNRYPIVGEPHSGRFEENDEPGRVRRSATGAHEVVVLSPDHRCGLGRLPDEQVLDVLRAIQSRMVAHAASGHRATQVVVNHGREAGASIGHPHAQLVAIDLDPPAVVEELPNLGEGACAICDEVSRLDARQGVVVGETVEAWSPWWSSTPYEILLAPRRHLGRFDDAGTDLESVATMLRRTLTRLDRALDDPPYNLFVHALPYDVEDSYHWHVHVRPRLEVAAGFELGTGILVNTVDPLVAASELRAAGDELAPPAPS